MNSQPKFPEELQEAGLHSLAYFKRELNEYSEFNSEKIKQRNRLIELFKKVGLPVEIPQSIEALYEDNTNPWSQHGKYSQSSQTQRPFHNFNESLTKFLSAHKELSFIEREQIHELRLAVRQSIHLLTSLFPKMSFGDYVAPKAPEPRVGIKISVLD